MSEITREKRDLVLPQGTHAYMQDVTKGVIKTYTGPTVINPTAQEVPVIYDPDSGTFQRAGSLEDALKVAPVAAEGHYIILRNPAKGNKHPSEGSAQPSEELEIGRKIVVPGPATFALWPAQSAEVIEGHHLRSNQYLLVRVYNEDEARKNWGKAVVKPAAAEGEASPTQPVTATPPPDLTVGKQLIIRGTEVSFYIPPTGIEVVASEEGVYARDALTLERLEYSILVDENGKKRYEIGPQVVFPLPSERFVEAKDDSGRQSKKFRAIELNDIQGLHVKVIAAYKEGGRDYKIGEELFITGKDTAIYFPREEHSAIKYDGKAKHFATAIPAGEARYVMNRLTGEIRNVKGPAMLLPDPRTEVVVRRVLTDKQCVLWYPSNTQVLEYNQGLRTILQNVPTTRQGAISEGDYERGVSRSRGGSAKGTAPVATNAVMESSHVSGDQGLVSDEFSRMSTYSQPRSITLFETKFQGAPSIDVWTGYAVLVVSKTGKRRVEHGPTTVLLEYDEAIQHFELSTGKPKTTDKLVSDVYLRVENNKVSDIINVETADHVQVQIYLSYLVNFEGDSLKWFSVENYVKFLCDHVRSVLKGAVRKLKVEDFYQNSTDLIRDGILGKSAEGKRTGMVFEQNGMRVSDVEVLKVALQDEKIRALLDQSQHQVVQTNIDLSNRRRDLEATKEREKITQEDAALKATTKTLNDKLIIDAAASDLAVALARVANQLKELDEKRHVVESEQAVEEVKFGTRLDRVKREKDQEFTQFVRDQEKKIELLKVEAETAVLRFQAASGNFSEALLVLSRNETLVKVAQAWDTQKLVEGESLGDTLHRLFHNTPLKALVDKIVSPNGQKPGVSPSLS